MSARSGSDDSNGGYITLLLSLCHNSLRAGRIQDAYVSLSCHGTTLDPHWGDFEERFLCATRHRPLRVGVRDSERTLDAILQGNILAKVDKAGRLLLERQTLKRVTKDMIISSPTNYTIDGITITLSPFQRFWLATCNNARAKEGYLKELTATERVKASAE